MYAYSTKSDAEKHGYDGLARMIPAAEVARRIRFDPPNPPNPRSILHLLKNCADAENRAEHRAVCRAVIMQMPMQNHLQSSVQMALQKIAPMQIDLQKSVQKGKAKGAKEKKDYVKVEYKNSATLAWLKKMAQMQVNASRQRKKAPMLMIVQFRQRGSKYPIVIRGTVTGRARASKW